jgi:hypothetical protein
VKVSAGKGAIPAPQQDGDPARAVWRMRSGAEGDGSYWIRTSDLIHLHAPLVTIEQVYLVRQLIALGKAVEF